jgi:hypothetical protein
MAAKPVSSIANPADGTIHVTYDDGSVQTFPAAQAQQLKLLPQDLKPATGASGGFGSAGGYGGNVPAGAFGGATAGTGTTIYDPNSGTSVSAAGSIPLKVGGKVVPTSIGDLLSQSRTPTNLAQIRKSLVKAALISKTEKNPTRIQNAWIQVLLGSQQSQMDPNDYLASLKAQGFGQNAPQVQTRITDYSKVADGYFYQIFNKVFGRMPTAMDMASPYKDAKGKTLTWQQALVAEAKKPQNQESVTTVTNPDGTVSSQTSTPGFDPTVWLQQQLTNSYADAIKAGKTTAQQSDIDKYNQLAAKYGINTIDPTTKQLDVNTRLDLANLERGTLTFDNIESNFKNMALAKYGYLKPQLDAGLSPMDIAKPAIDTVSQLLEKNPATVTLDDPYVQKYLQGDGKTTMSQSDLQSMVKQDPSWKYTQNAHAQLSDLASSVLQRFGFNA